MFAHLALRKHCPSVILNRMPMHVNIHSLAATKIRGSVAIKACIISNNNCIKRFLGKVEGMRGLADTAKKSPEELSTSGGGGSSTHKHTARVNSKGLLTISFPDGKRTIFHSIWLRDHCRCSECFHSITKQRLVDTFKVPLNIVPKKNLPYQNRDQARMVRS